MPPEGKEGSGRGRRRVGASGVAAAAACFFFPSFLVDHIHIFQGSQLLREGRILMGCLHWVEEGVQKKADIKKASAVLAKQIVTTAMLPKRYFCRVLIEKVVTLLCRQAKDVPNSPHYANMIYVLPSRRERMKMMMEMEGGRDENNNRERPKEMFRNV